MIINNFYTYNSIDDEHEIYCLKQHIRTDSWIKISNKDILLCVKKYSHGVHLFLHLRSNIIILIADYYVNCVAQQNITMITNSLYKQTINIDYVQFDFTKNKLAFEKPLCYAKKNDLLILLKTNQIINAFIEQTYSIFLHIKSGNVIIVNNNLFKDYVQKI